MVAAVLAPTMQPDGHGVALDVAVAVDVGDVVLVLVAVVEVLGKATPLHAAASTAAYVTLTAAKAPSALLLRKPSWRQLVPSAHESESSFVPPVTYE